MMISDYQTVVSSLSSQSHCAQTGSLYISIRLQKQKQFTFTFKKGNHPEKGIVFTFTNTPLLSKCDVISVSLLLGPL